MSKEVLSPRERVRLAMNHQEADRVPIELGGGITSCYLKLYEKIGDRCGIEFWKQWASNWAAFKFDERVLERMHVDSRHLYFATGGAKQWTPSKIYPDGSFEDFWGIRYVVKDGCYSNMIENPLSNAQNVGDIEKYFAALPDPALVGEDGALYLDEDAKYLYEKTGYAVKGEPMWSFFEFCQWLRGMENFLVDLYINEDMADALMSNLFDYQTKMFEAYFAKTGKYLDWVWTSDDFGAQEQLLISEDMWRSKIKPWVKKRADYIKERTNAKLFHHSCGSIHSILPDMIECGYDGINPLQPFAKNMEPERLKKDFGGKLFFMGGMDHQFILQKEPEEALSFCKRLVKAYAPGGGFIFAPTHVVPDSVNLDSLFAVFDFVYESCTYPIQID